MGKLLRPEDLQEPRSGKQEEALTWHVRKELNGTTAFKWKRVFFVGLLLLRSARTEKRGPENMEDTLPVHRSPLPKKMKHGARSAQVSGAQ